MVNFYNENDRKKYIKRLGNSFQTFPGKLLNAKCTSLENLNEKITHLFAFDLPCLLLVALSTRSTWTFCTSNAWSAGNSIKKKLFTFFRIFPSTIQQDFLFLYSVSVIAISDWKNFLKYKLHNVVVKHFSFF